MKKVVLLIMCGFLFWTAAAGIASASYKAVEMFDNVRKYRKAELLGAADRAAYALSGEERDVFVLLLEEQLMLNWHDENMLFTGQDAQEVMRAAFGDKFEVGKLEEVADYTVRAALREVLDSGYIIEQKNGHFYPWIDYDYLYTAYAATTSPEIGDYFSLRRKYMEITPQDWHSRADFLIMAEGYMKKYPDAFRKPDVNKLYREQLFSYFLITAGGGALIAGLDREAPAVVKIGDAIVASYRRLLREFPDSQPGWFAGRLLSEWEKEKYIAGPAMAKVLAEYGRRLDNATMEKLTGIYTDDFGSGVFKPAGGNRYLLLNDARGLLTAENIRLTGSRSGYIIAEIKGVTAKNLPLSVKEAVYPQAFVLNQVVAASIWPLDSGLFPADFFIVGVEPFWNMRILTNAEIIFEQAGNGRPDVFPYIAPVQEKCREHSADCWHYKLPGSLAGGSNLLEITVVKQNARDPMAGAEYKYTARILYAGRVYEGFAFRPGERPQNPAEPAVFKNPD